jgi:glycosyltransferase involved in cell wall biosynthesis
MTTSVIIATFNRAALLAETLEAMAGQECPPGGFEIIVADNGSTDHTADVVREASARVPIEYLLVTAPGKSHAVNAAIERARGDLLLFTDDDVLPVPGWLLAWTRAFAQTGADFGAGRILPRWGATPPSWMSPALYGVLAVPDNGTRRLCGDELRAHGVMPIGANMAIRRAVLQRVGGWRTDLGKLRGTLRTGEDHELFLRLVHSGAMGIYEPGALVHHLVPESRMERSYFRQWFYGNGRTVARLESEYPSTARRLAGVPRYLWRSAVTDAARAVRGAVSGNPASRFAGTTRLIWFAGFLREAWGGGVTKVFRAAAWERAAGIGRGTV